MIYLISFNFTRSHVIKQVNCINVPMEAIGPNMKITTSALTSNFSSEIDIHWMPEVENNARIDKNTSNRQIA